MRNSNPHRHVGSHKAGLIFGLISAACVGLTSALTNSLVAVIFPAAMAFTLGVTGLVVLTPWVFKRLPALLKADSIVVWIRAIAGAVSIECFIWNLQHADVGTAHILFNFSLIFVLAAEYVTGKAQFSYSAATCVVMAAIGIAIYWYDGKLLVNFDVWAIGLLGAAFATLAYIALSRAALKYDPLLILWTLSLVLIPVSILAKSGGWVMPSSKVLLVVVLISLGNLLAQFLLNLSFKLLPLPVATAIVPSCVLWGVLIVEITQRVVPSRHAIVGMLTYVVSIGLLIADSKKKSTRCS